MKPDQSKKKYGMFHGNIITYLSALVAYLLVKNNEGDLRDRLVVLK